MRERREKRKPSYKIVQANAPPATLQAIPERVSAHEIMDTDDPYVLLLLQWLFSCLIVV